MNDDQQRRHQRAAADAGQPDRGCRRRGRRAMTSGSMRSSALPTCSPHSVLSVPAQRPSRPLPGWCTARSRSTRSPGRAAGGTAGRARGSAARGPSRSSRRAGCTSTSRASRPTRPARRVARASGACSRRMPVIHASAPASARSSAATFAAPQQCSGPVHGSPVRVLDLDRDAEALLERRQVASVSGNSTPVSIVTTRASRREPHELVEEHRLLLLEGAQRARARSWRSAACASVVA